MIKYTNSIENITTEMLGDGFFAGCLTHLKRCAYENFEW